MKNFKILFLLFTALITGCASNYGITYNSEPQGASLVCNGINKGYTSKTLYYKLDKENKKNGSLRTQTCEARWVSGARKTYSNTWDLNKFPKGVMQTLQRPNVPGYSQDAEFALKVKQMKIQKEQSDAAKTININPNPVKQCRKVGDLSGQIYQFQGFCPFGYY